MEKTNHTDSPCEGVAASREGGAFWQAKTLAELAAEQGIAPMTDFDVRLGQGSDLWADDAEFDAFLARLHEIRREGR
jgi:hypothetical protein